ncbi:hypothetical protein CRENBAI_006945 [Crenichthys baileyi]|uniref:Uncharacterized protein n=1 Tax=Crenichthys baileyi TaxID=28760 RepID=A0AAV9RB64_9TELE
MVQIESSEVCPRKRWRAEGSCLLEGKQVDIRASKRTLVVAGHGGCDQGSGLTRELEPGVCEPGGVQQTLGDDLQPPVEGGKEHTDRPAQDLCAVESRGQATTEPACLTSLSSLLLSSSVQLFSQQTTA